MNTGNIGRLSLASGCNLHLVKPLGFELDDKRVKRAGLDYWKHISLHIYESSEEFFETHKSKSMAFFSSHGQQDHWSIDYAEDMFLIFGKESVGLSPAITEAHTEQLYQIPIDTTHVRSLNLANAVSIVIYEGLRQLR